jgi:hypothetical protein
MFLYTLITIVMTKKKTQKNANRGKYAPLYIDEDDE